MDGGFTYYITLQEPSLSQNDEQIAKFLNFIGMRVLEILNRSANKFSLSNVSIFIWCPFMKRPADVASTTGLWGMQRRKYL